MKRVALGTGSIGPIASAVLESDPQTVEQALRLGVTLEPLRPFVGRGATADLWEALASLAASDVALARALEPHLDAVTILDQAAVVRPPSSSTATTWGVFAAEAPGHRLTARADADGWTVSGTKAWCSLGGSLSHALVTAWVDDDRRGLFAVDLKAPGIEVADGQWVALGLREIPSGDIAFTAVSADPVGAAGWYLDRPGFAWGGMSVAACWFGGAVGVARTLLETARERTRVADRPEDAILLLHLGIVDARLTEARTVLTAAAAAVDAGAADDGLVVKRVRATVARTAEAVLHHVGHALGPAPLARDATHAKRVADLGIYLRQHHGERDDVSLGRAVVDSDTPW